MQGRPPLNAVRAFEVAARHLSFADAAEELAVTPAAISHHVKRLEDALEYRLFNRLNRSVSLTPVGEELSRRLTSILSDLDIALLDAARGPSDRLRITALPSLAVKWLLPRLSGFEALHPDIELDIDASDVLVNNDTHPAVVALRYGLGGYPGLHVERLMDADVIAVCSPRLLAGGAHPLTASTDLRHYRLLHDSTYGNFNSGKIPNWRRWLHMAGIVDVDLSRGTMFGSIHLALDAAVAGQGVALAPVPLVLSDIEAGRLVRVIDDVEMKNPCAFWIVCADSKIDDPGVVAFRTWALAEARASRLRFDRARARSLGGDDQDGQASRRQPRSAQRRRLGKIQSESLVDQRVHEGEKD
jgi:LysR family glycine cleavage system transcriptional activator